MNAAVPTYTLGLDLGQAHDHSALCALERLPGPSPKEPVFHVRHLHRWPLDTC